MRLPIKTLKHALYWAKNNGHYDPLLEEAVHASVSRGGYFAEYQGADFTLTAGLIPEDTNVYLRLENPEQSYKVLSGPLIDFAAMLVEYHRTNEEEED